MSRLDRLYKLQERLNTQSRLRKSEILRELEVSEATLKRDIAYMRDRFNVPLHWDGEQGSWWIDKSATVGPQLELPHMYFSADESRALLTMVHLLSNLDPGGMLGREIAPLMKRLNKLLGSGAPPKAEVARRIRPQPIAARRVHTPHYESVASALLRRLRLVVEYHNRSRDELTEREVSPQRLVHYRDNWYLDAWCHLRGALRSFGVDSIRRVRVLDRAAIEIADAELDAVLGAGYGIFSGTDVRRAGLRFSKAWSRMVSSETWHAQQHGRFDAEGRWILELPYSDPRELVMDILRHVPEVEVLWPEELADEVRRRLRDALSAFDGNGALLPPELYERTAAAPAAGARIER